MNFIKIKGREGIGREAGRKIYKALSDKEAIDKEANILPNYLKIFINMLLK